MDGNYQQQLDDMIIKFYTMSKDVEKKIRDGIYTTKKELDDEAYKIYVKQGYLERQLYFKDNDDEKDEEIREKLDRLELRNQRLKLLEEKYYYNNAFYNKQKDMINDALNDAVRTRESLRELPRIGAVNIPKLVNELKKNKK